MTDRTAILLDWWAANGGLFVNLDQVVPYVVIHSPPMPTDEFPSPLLIGPESYQAKLLRSPDPSELYKAVAEMPADYRRAVSLCHARTVAAAEPDLIDRKLTLPSDLGGDSIGYRRLLLPVRTKTGDPLILTHTVPLAIH